MMAAISARVNCPFGLILPFAPDNNPSCTARVIACADQLFGKSEKSVGEMANADAGNNIIVANTMAIVFFRFK